MLALIGQLIDENTQQIFGSQISITHIQTMYFSYTLRNVHSLFQVFQTNQEESISMNLKMSSGREKPGKSRQFIGQI